MARRQQVKADQLARELVKFEEHAFGHVRGIVRRAAVRGREAAIELAGRGGHRVSGDYERGFYIRQTPDGATLGNNAQHAGVLETGRKPGRKPPPVAVILLWMQEKGISGKIPGFSVNSHVAMAMKFSKQDKRFTDADRTRIRGKVEERARQHKLNSREQFILAAWRRARAIAKAIGIRGIRGRFIVARSIPAIGRQIKSELRQFKRA